jgi:hypothetical protein
VAPQTNDEENVNKDLELYARGRLLETLEQIPQANQRIFKLMYGRDNGKRSVEDTENLPMSAVIAEIHNDNLDWAMQQVANTIRKMQRKTA